MKWPITAGVVRRAAVAVLTSLLGVAVDVGLLDGRLADALAVVLSALSW